MGSLGQLQIASAEQQFCALYRRHFGFVWSLTAHFGVPHGAREDVAQEVWFAVHRRLDDLRPEASTRAWVAAITRNVALHHHRSQSRRTRKHAALVAVSDVVQHPPPTDAIAVIEAAVGQLEPGQREVFLLVGVEELSGPEVAQVLGLPLNTVYSRLRLARARLAAAMTEHDADGLDALRVPASPRASQRVWLVLAKDLGFGVAAPAALPTVFAGKFATALGGAAAATTIAAALAAGVLGVVGPTAHARSPSADRASAVRVDVAATDREIVVAAPPVAELAASTVTRSAIAVASSSKGAPMGASRRAPAPRDAAKTTASAGSSSDAPSTLAAETALLGEARRALTGGDLSRARDLLDRHAARFPNGVLAPDRDAAARKVACAMGDAGTCEALTSRPRNRTTVAPS